MFSFHLQQDGSYIINLIDGGSLHVKVPDTYHLRLELAKLARRIETREYIIHHEDFIPTWWANIKNLTQEQIEKLSEVYSPLCPTSEEWVLLDTYEDETDKLIATLERDVLGHKLLIDHLKTTKSQGDIYG